MQSPSPIGLPHQMIRKANYQANQPTHLPDATSSSGKPNSHKVGYLPPLQKVTQTQGLGTPEPPVELPTPSVINPTLQPAPQSNQSGSASLVQPFANQPEPNQPFLKPLAPTVTSEQPSERLPSQPELADSVNPSVSATAVQLAWIGPKVLRLRTPTRYSLVVKNVSQVPVHQVLVAYQPPEGIRIVSEDVDRKAHGKMLTWQVGSLQPDQEHRIRLDVLAEAKTDMVFNAATTFTTLSSMAVQIREPKLVVNVAAPQTVVVGSSVTLAMMLANPGDGPTDPVKVKVALPQGLEHVRGSMIDLDIGVLKAQESRNLQLVCLAKEQGPMQCEILASAGADLRAKKVVAMKGILPRIDVTVTGPKLRYLNRPAVYVVKVTNPSSAPTSNVTIREVVPSGFEFRKATHGGTYDASNRTVSWFLGDMTGGQSQEVQLEMMPTATGEHRHVFLVQAARGMQADSEIVTRVEGLSALQMALTDSNDPVEIGADTVYQLRITNTGSKTETNVLVGCLIPAGMEFRSAACSSQVRFQATGAELVFQPVAELEPQATITYQIRMRGKTSGDQRFRALIRADSLSQPVLREESTKVYGDQTVTR